MNFYTSPIYFHEILGDCSKNPSDKEIVAALKMINGYELDNGESGDIKSPLNEKMGDAPNDISVNIDKEESIEKKEESDELSEPVWPQSLAEMLLGKLERKEEIQQEKLDKLEAALDTLAEDDIPAGISVILIDSDAETYASFLCRS